MPQLPPKLTTDKPKRKPYSSRCPGITSTQWRKMSQNQLRLDPICACGELATQADHIVPWTDYWSFVNNPLQSLCSACHLAKTLSGQ